METEKKLNETFITEPVFTSLYEFPVKVKCITLNTL